MSIVTAERVEDARTIVNAIAAEYATVTGGAKPRVGSWTFRKDMAVLGLWFAYLCGETDQPQQVWQHHPSMLLLLARRCTPYRSHPGAQIVSLTFVHFSQVDGKS